MLTQRKRPTRLSRKKKRSAKRDETVMKSRSEIPPPEPHRSSDTDSETDEEDIDKLKRSILPQFGAAHMQVIKLLTYAKVGNPTATVLSLVAILDLNLSNESVQRSVVEAGGTEVLIRLVRSKHLPSKVASLRILASLTNNRLVCDDVLRFEGVKVLITALRSPHPGVASTAAIILGCLCSSRRAQKAIRHQGGLAVLANKVCCPQHEQSSASSLRRHRVQRASSRGVARPWHETAYAPSPTVVMTAYVTAVWCCCGNACNRTEIVRRSSSLIGYIDNALETGDETLTMAALKVLERCSLEVAFRKRLSTSQVFGDVVVFLRHPQESFRLLATTIVSHCAVDSSAKDNVRELGGLASLLANYHDSQSEDSLLEITCGAITRLMDASNDNIKWFKESQIGVHFNEDVQRRITDQRKRHCFDGIRLLFTQDVVLQDHVIEQGSCHVALRLIQQTEANLVVAALRFLATASCNDDVKIILIENDALRFCWSHLKSPSTEIVVCAADAIHALIESPLDTAETVRSFVGGLELLVKTLASALNEVVAATARVVSRVVLDEENSSILVEYGVLDALEKHCGTVDEASQEAICLCLKNFHAPIEGHNAVRSVVPRLCHWLASSDSIPIRREAVHALQRLSIEADNCLAMYQHGVVKHLLIVMATDDEFLQESVAKCLQRIRMVAVAQNGKVLTKRRRTKKAKLKSKPKRREEIVADDLDMSAARSDMGTGLSGFSDLYSRPSSLREFPQEDENGSSIDPSLFSNNIAISIGHYGTPLGKKSPSHYSEDSGADEETATLTVNDQALRGNSAIDGSLASLYEDDYGSSDFESYIEAETDSTYEADGLDTSLSGVVAQGTMAASPGADGVDLTPTRLSARSERPFTVRSGLGVDPIIPES